MQNTNVEKNLQFEYIRAFSIVAVITTKRNVGVYFFYFFESDH